MAAAAPPNWIQTKTGKFRATPPSYCIQCLYDSSMDKIFSHNSNDPLTDRDLRTITDTEWLVTNGRGAYASGTVGGGLTRVFHGYLIAALPAPLGRTMMLNELRETLVLSDGRSLSLNGLKTEDSEFAGS